MDEIITVFPLILQQKNFILLSIFEKAINNVSKRIKFQTEFKIKGKLSEHIDKMQSLIINKHIYLTVVVFFSIFIAIGAQTKRANKKLPNEEKHKIPVGRNAAKIKVPMKTRKEPIKIKKTIKVTL